PSKIERGENSLTIRLAGFGANREIRPSLHGRPRADVYFTAGDPGKTNAEIAKSFRSAPAASGMAVKFDWVAREDLAGREFRLWRGWWLASGWSPGQLTLLRLCTGHPSHVSLTKNRARISATPAQLDRPKTVLQSTRRSIYSTLTKIQATQRRFIPELRQARSRNGATEFDELLAHAPRRLPPPGAPSALLGHQHAGRH
ncbi:MAG: hypothetical protein ACI841_001256, partial [Planctomycetota bacterium]